MTTTLPGEPGLPDLEGPLTRIPLFAEIDRVTLAQLAAHLDPIAWCLAWAAPYWRLLGLL